jgi:exodeoxyribonuclease V alpha subunit
VGTHKLNALLQNFFEDKALPTLQMPRNRWDKEVEVFFRKGSKVIMARNDYQLNVFNGETGLITDMDTEEGHIEVDFGDRRVTFPPELTNRKYDAYREEWVEYTYDPRKELYLAYALTTHKTQGSEYENVIYIMNRSHYGLLNRRNFYTAITRAKKHVTVVTEARAIQTALRFVDSQPMKGK